MEYTVEDSKYDATRSLYPSTDICSVDGSGNVHAYDINLAPITVDQASISTLAQQLYDAEVIRDANRISAREAARQAIRVRLGVSEQTFNDMSTFELFKGIIDIITSYHPPEDTHYVTLDGVDDYISLTGTGNCMDLSHGANWTLGFTVDQNYVGNSDKFSPIQSGDNNWTLYNGGLHSTIGDAVNALHWNTAAYAQGIAAGDKIILRADGTHVQFWWNNVQKHQATLGTSNVGAGSFDNLTIGNATTSATAGAVPNWNASIDNLLICANHALDFNEMAEFFNSNDFDTYSFKDTKLTDFVTMGEDTYPNITGDRGVVTGTLVNGTPDNFVERS